MEVSEKLPAEKAATCSRCGLESRDPRKYCPRCGFPFASVFKQPVSTLQSLEPAIRTSMVLFGINLLYLLLKVTPKSVHLHIEIAVSLLFASIVLIAVRPFQAKIRYLCGRFFNRRYPPVKMVSLALLTAAVIHLYFEAFGLLGLQTLSYIEEEDIGTLMVPWVFISAVVLAPIFEEIFFRGYLFQKFRLVLKPRDAILLQGLMFGIIHLHPATYISHTLLGLLFGFLRHKTNSLLPGMYFHALWNLSVIGWEYWRLTVDRW